MQKTSMSVKEMQNLLGIGKTESYWLLKKDLFQVREVAGRKRIMIHSFEEWYKNQTHYKKVNGANPGTALIETYSSKQIEIMLGISRQTANSLAGRGYFEAFKEGQYYRIVKDSFEKWYASQFRYKKVNGEAPGSNFPKSMSAREMSELLGVPLHNTGYDIIVKGYFKSFTADRQLRVDVESFEEWYSTQTHYKKVKEN